MSCLFCKISAGAVPAIILYKDDKIIAFNDVNPQAPVHAIIIPRQHIETLNDIDEANSALLGSMFIVAKKIAHEAKVDVAGYRTVINCNGGAGQSVFHLHLHLLGGRAMQWPPG